jgi:putative transposase
MLTYRAELVGIRVEVMEESYTGKTSLLDLDPWPVRKPDNEEVHTFSGKRIKPAQDRRALNADCNGSGNMIRKEAPDACRRMMGEDGKGVPASMLASLVVCPVRIVVPLTKPKSSDSSHVPALQEIARERFISSPIRAQSERPYVALVFHL